MKDLLSTSLRRRDGVLEILDQQKLPHEAQWLKVDGPDTMVAMVKALKVRGAPLIGIASSLTLAHWAQEKQSLHEFMKVAERLKAARPTAVNLMNNIDSLVQVARETSVSPEALLEKADDLYQEDVDLCLKMGETGAAVIQPRERILTHCNTGGLATVGRGTALGVIATAAAQDKSPFVYVDETRPLLQGGRLTAWELEQQQIPYEILCDNMAGFLMAQKKVDRIFVGADRIACNGDFANKIGTYSLAVLARYHQVPFYVVAPQTTIDPQCRNGDDIPIEIRSASEVKGVAGSFGSVQWAPEKAEVYNPAFDVTPAHLVTGFIIDEHLFQGPEASQELNSYILKK